VHRLRRIGHGTIGPVGGRYGRKAALAAAAMLLAACSSHGGHDSRRLPASSAAHTDPSYHASASSAAPAESAEQRAARRTAERAHARADVARVVAEEPDGAAAIAAQNLTTGAKYVGGYQGRIWTASLYKLLVLETLLIQHGPLSGGELAQATTMIENSDNVAGYALWETAGGNAGLTRAMHALHMTHSVADGTDPTFTKLTASDALQLARALVTKGPIGAAAQRQALRLMRNVEADQRWGVGVVADKGTDFANKNGWLSIQNDNEPSEDDGGRWAVTSVGVVRVHGQQVIMAVLSEHNASLSDGVDVIQALAKDAAVLVAPAAS